MSMSELDVIGTGKYDGIDALLDSFHQSAGKADLKTYFGCFDKQGRFLGTDPAENWSARDFYVFTKPHFAAGNGWTYHTVPKSRKVTYFPGPSAEGASFCTFDELLFNDSFGSCRGSGTLVYNTQANSWLIAAYHLSFPVPNDLAEEVTDKLKSADTGYKQMQADIAAAELLAELELEETTTATRGSSKKKNKSNK